MSPLMEKILEEKRLRRRRLMELPYPEKVKIVEQMRSAAGPMKASMKPVFVVNETPEPYQAAKRL